MVIELTCSPFFTHFLDFIFFLNFQIRTLRSEWSLSWNYVGDMKSRMLYCGRDGIVIL